ncbi:MAG: protoglobin domain-containing protein [Myxococcota bacterium]|nr:protoglobin domain-containing protein [Myxococcota bacterium]
MAASRPETLFEEMKRYVGFADDDARALRELAPIAAPHFREIAEEFYEQVRQHEDAHAVFRDEAQIERLKVTLVRWMGTLCAGPHDEAYFEERAKIGRMHVRIGLPQRYMFTAMALIRVALERYADRTSDAGRTREALNRIIDLELAIMLETYREDSEARLQRIERLEKQELARALARSEHRYASAIELANVIVVGLDREGRILLWNQEAERTTGRARDEVLAERFVDVALGEDAREAAATRIAALTERGIGGPWELELVTRAGKRRHASLHLTYVPDAAGDAVVAFAIGRDDTDERAREERTMQSEKLAAVGTLAAGLAHEIRNPLNGALLHVTYLERALAKKGEGADTLDAVKLVGDEIRRLSALVKDFLVFARPSAPDLRLVPLRSIAERVAGIAKADADAAGATIVTDWGGSELLVDVDAGKIEQAVLNLSRNAIDAVAPAGGGTVTLRLRRTPRHAVLEVEDDGPGLPNPDAPIFDAFYSTKAHGTGLGLAIVHRVVTDHRGTIDVESKPGRTLFRITLPLKEAV